MRQTKTVELGGRTLTIETGHVAKLASGSAIIQYGETVVLATAVADFDSSPDRDFLPLTVDYREKAYASGKIPGGFFKREGRPTDKETLSARLIDRPIRPLFPEFYDFETQVMISVLSSDRENDSDVLGLVAASTALTISNIPFQGPIAAVRVGKVDGELLVNPTHSTLEQSTMDIIVAGSHESIIMVEGAAKESSEAEILEALRFGHDQLQLLLPLQDELARSIGNVNWEVPQPEIPDGLPARVTEKATSNIQEALQQQDKAARKNLLRTVKTQILEAFLPEYPDAEKLISRQLHDIEKELMRNMILNESKRIDGRGLDDIRDITCETSVLPRTHGSAIFTRGTTQALAVTTLGTKIDEQKIENLMEVYWKRFMLHYNFPPYSVGETRPNRGPGRREIGHGRLAERGLDPMIPGEKDFPYTIRIVSEILESNGSSSMATVCAGSLSLMDAGVPIPKAVGGVAMGLIKEESNVAILTDILGDEDHLGDMDFKVAGSKDGITAFQMDVKITGVSYEVLAAALEKARIARLSIIDKMNSALAEPKPKVSEYAPKIIRFIIDPECIGMIIGPGGKTIRGIQTSTGVLINVEDDGSVSISADDFAGLDRAKALIDSILEVPEVGKVYLGTVRKIMPFGAFMEILPGKDGLLHISEIEHYRIKSVEDVLQMGQQVEVKILKIDDAGKIDLSRKVLIERPKSSNPGDGKRKDN